MKLKKCLLTITLIAGMVFLFSRCINSAQPEANDVRGAAYAGSASCGACHKAIAGAYKHTSHFHTSRPLNGLPDSIQPPSHGFTFNDRMTVAVEKRDSGVFQVAYVDGKETLAGRFELAFGSGEKAFSFGYWQNDRLYQLPLSYFRGIQGWANSPGFPAHQANFSRLIIRRCFECHSSYIAEAAGQAESISQARSLEPKSIVYGIDCERCHGPAADHVAFQTEHPGAKESRHLISWKSLTRQQKLDACAVCHSGNDLATQQSTFEFRPGDTLSRFYYPEFSSGGALPPDVHGKQMQLLASSRCFLKSNTLECSTCHNPHGSGPDDMASYSKQCLSCHQHADHIDCPKAAALGNAITNNCIDCHMPKQASTVISFQAAGDLSTQPYLLRTHRIAVYGEKAEVARK